MIIQVGSGQYVAFTDQETGVIHVQRLVPHPADPVIPAGFATEAYVFDFVEWLLRQGEARGTFPVVVLDRGAVAPYLDNPDDAAHLKDATMDAIANEVIETLGAWIPDAIRIAVQKVGVPASDSDEDLLEQGTPTDLPDWSDEP